jgi:hypothetical protein
VPRASSRGQKTLGFHFLSPPHSGLLGCGNSGNPEGGIAPPALALRMGPVVPTSRSVRQEEPGTHPGPFAPRSSPLPAHPGAIALGPSSLTWILCHHLPRAAAVYCQTSLKGEKYSVELLLALNDFLLYCYSNMYK